MSSYLQTSARIIVFLIDLALLITSQKALHTEIRRRSILAVEISNTVNPCRSVHVNDIAAYHGLSCPQASQLRAHNYVRSLIVTYLGHGS